MERLHPVTDLILGLALILLGVKVIDYFGVYSPPMKYLGGIGFLMILGGGWNVLINSVVLAIAFYFKVIAQDYDPKTDNEQHKTAVGFLRIVLILLVVWLIFLINPLDNILNGMDLVVKSAIAGLIIGLFILLVILVPNRNLRLSALGLDVFFGIPMICVVLAIDIAGTLNQTVVANPVKEEFAVKRIDEFRDLEIIGQEQQLVRRYVFVDYLGREERLTIECALKDEIRGGDVIELELTRGMMGYYNVIGQAEVKSPE